MEPVPYELLVDLAEGRLSLDEATTLRARLAHNPDGQVRLAEIEQLIDLMRTDDSVDAPDHVIARSLRLMRPPATVSEQPPLQRLTAQFIRDSWRLPALAPGMRSLRAWPRALLFKAGDYELDLQIGPRGEQWQLSGQILGPEAPGTVTLSGAGDQVSTTLSPLGEFVMAPVPAGTYRLSVTQNDIEIVVPSLELGPSAANPE